MSRVDGWTMPLNILFFVISGAELDLNVVVQPVTLLVGIIYIIARSAGKYSGSYLSCRLTRQSTPTTHHLGITLLPQAGVALGMSATVAAEFGEAGAIIRNIILFSVLIYELAGPIMTKMALTAAGEITPKPSVKRGDV